MLILLGAGIGLFLGGAVFLAGHGAPSSYQHLRWEALWTGLVGGATFGFVLFLVFKV